MKILILTAYPESYSSSRLIEEGEKRGHQVDVVNPLKCYMDITSKNPMVLYKDGRLNGYDAVVPRIASSMTFYGMSILRQFEMMGVFPANESSAIGRSRDKLRSLQLLSKKGLGLPRTSFAHSTEQTEKLISLVGGAPLIVKLLEGTQGKGVVLAETQKAAESVIDAFREMNANFLVQEFVKEANGSDIRAFVIGDKVVAAMERTAKEGEFRSNLHRGGSAKITKLSKEERQSAIGAAKAMGLGIAGVDLLRSNTGPKILEVNSSPGLEGIEGSTGKNVAGMIYDYIEEHAKKNIIRVKGRG